MKKRRKITSRFRENNPFFFRLCSLLEFCQSPQDSLPVEAAGKVEEFIVTRN